MNNLRNIVIALMVLATLPLAAQAMQHGSGSMDMDHSKMDMDHGKMDMDHSKMDHDGMMMDGDMIMLGDSVQDGVKAMAHLKDVKAAMTKMGMQTTHHLMVLFADTATGKPIDSGTAAVKVKGPTGEETGPIKLMGMQGHFGADIELAEPGEYHFAIGTKLADGKKRQYDFDFTLQ